MRARNLFVLVGAFCLAVVMADPASAHVSYNENASSTGCAGTCSAYVSYSLDSLPNSTYCIGSYGSYTACRVYQYCYASGSSTLPGTVNLSCNIGGSACAVAVASGCSTSRSGYSTYIPNGTCVSFSAQATFAGLAGSATASAWSHTVCVDNVGAY
jgi:hypothetical protein